MKKIPTIFERDFDGDPSRVLDKINPHAQWVHDGIGIATRKVDGTCCMVRDGRLYKRREIKAGKPTPPDFESCEADTVTGKVMGWLPVTDAPEDHLHREAFANHIGLSNGTYELLGPKVQGNPERLTRHELWAHDSLEIYADAPRDHAGLKAWLQGRDIEGLVWHAQDGRMAKIKLSDFGLKRGQ